MPRAKKAPSTTAASAVKAMLAAATPLPDVPKHVKLREGDVAFWEGIVRARSRDEWTAVTLIVAAQLARCQADIERESTAAATDGRKADVDKARSIQAQAEKARESLLDEDLLAT